MIKKIEVLTLLFAVLILSYAGPLMGAAPQGGAAHQTQAKKEPLGVSIGVGALLSPTFRSLDGQRLEFGYRRDKWAVDLRGIVLQSSYSRVSVDTDNPPDPPEPELDENGNPLPIPVVEPFHHDSDPWKGIVFDLGLSYFTTPFPSWAPKLQERTRLGLCNWGAVKDQVHSISYRPSIFSVESGLDYPPFEKWPIKVNLVMNWRFGYFVTKDPVDVSIARLPTSTVTLSTGISYEF